MVARQNLTAAAHVYIDGKPYALLDAAGTPPHDVEPRPVQPGEEEVEFERRLINLGLGWGRSKYVGAGGYDYADSGVLHQKMRWRPGALVTEYSPATTPDGPCYFGEYWDGTDANRRLIIVTSRYVYEVTPAGALSTNDLTAVVPSGARMTVPKRFKAPTAMASPQIYIPVQKGGVTDYFIVRTAANTYQENTGAKRAVALGVGKDSVGEWVMWRVNEDGKLNQTTADSDPNAGASWSGSVYAVGETSGIVNDIAQQNRKLIVGRTDGAFTFDLQSNAIPITVGMEQTPDDNNFRKLADFNGLAMGPTVQGLVWIDGLDWGVAGPVSSNEDASSLRGREVAVSDQAGAYLYSAVWVPENDKSYIFQGTVRTDSGADGETGQGRFIWHGPVAVVNYQVTDLWVSTVYGKRLWWGAVAVFGDIQLNDDFSPKTDAASGYIYLPDGVLDMEGPGVIKDLRKAEFIAPGATPFSASNQWTVEVDVGAGYVAVDGGAVATGTYGERFWTTETAGRRPRVRLHYTANTGSAELEACIIRGTQRPETTDVHVFRIVAVDGPRLPGGARDWRAAQTIEEDLRALVDAGRKTVILYGRDTFTGQVKEVLAKRTPRGRTAAPTAYLEIRVRKVKVA
jgi:hypothetical protein